jgi:hypothetical protein
LDIDTISVQKYQQLDSRAKNFIDLVYVDLCKRVEQNEITRDNAIMRYRAVLHYCFFCDASPEFNRTRLKINGKELKPNLVEIFDLKYFH